MTDGKRRFLVVPAGGAGNGTGHLARCIRLSRSVGGEVTFLTTRLDADARSFLQRELLRFPARRRPAVINRIAAGGIWDVVLVDARSMTREELDAVAAHGPVVCLDEGGEAREFASFLVDALPGLPGRSDANLSSLAFLDLPPRARKKAGEPVRKVLLTFGGEDKANLTGRLLAALSSGDFFSPDQVTVVEGPLFRVHDWPQGVEVVKSPGDLPDLLSGYDLVFTHFGNTAFEALAAGVPAILLSPTRYHDSLGAACGFPRIGVGHPDALLLRRALQDARGRRALVDDFNARLGKDRSSRLAPLVASLRPRGSPLCPLCDSSGNRVTARFPDRTYRRCRHCGIVYLESFAAEPKRYGRSYFSSEYRAQYGRTYLEDFDSIKSASRPRVRLVRELTAKGVDGVVVDIGCAYGPFLDALKEEGVPGYGVDVSPAAVSYVRKSLGIPAFCGSFEDAARSDLPRRISAVTLWYVIEHFIETDLVLRKASSLLPAGGVLAFSTPNARGISGRKGIREFLRNSPADHFTVFSPRRLGDILAQYGLTLRRIRVTGHHPERFPGAIGAAARRWRVAYRLVVAVSRFVRLGDTFEAYAVKEPQ
jgi:2-polyprenyl-3-methyl-5-hydroxy-6-metoxy-1,4-benzoquinol methylase/spore coat polysaccharide biosynthesis predicted glycosyltransferase SpsG